MTLVVFPLANQVPVKECSITPLMNQVEKAYNLDPVKFTVSQLEEIKENLQLVNKKVRIASFNMLFNIKDLELPFEHQWPQRLPRVVATIQEMNPDILCCQELYGSQLKDLIDKVGDVYSYHSKPAADSEQNAILYKKNRFDKLDVPGESVWEMTYISKPSEPQLFPTPGTKLSPKTLVMTQLKDRITEKALAIFNTHFAFFNANEREFNAKFAIEKIGKYAEQMPVFFTGDLNTISPRMDSPIAPFFDGNYIQRILTSTYLKNARDIALLGHLGPLSTFTNTPNIRNAFQDTGTPGNFLDHIYVNKKVTVLLHAVQSIKVGGHYPSDHMPVVADVLLKDSMA